MSIFDEDLVKKITTGPIIAESWIEKQILDCVEDLNKNEGVYDRLDLRDSILDLWLYQTMSSDGFKYHEMLTKNGFLLPTQMCLI